MLAELDAAASTIALPSPRAMRSRCLRSTGLRISFPLPICRRPILRNPQNGKQGHCWMQRRRARVPKIFFSHTSYEYWGRAASLIHTTADGKADAPISPNVRIYFYSGLQHFSVAFPPQMMGTGDRESQQLPSPLPIRWFWRAMIANMDAWVRTAPSRRQPLSPRSPMGRWCRSPSWPSRRFPGRNETAGAARRAGIWISAELARRHSEPAAAAVGYGLSDAGAAGRCGWQRSGRHTAAGD
jgi:hypothetical protein